MESLLSVELPRHPEAPSLARRAVSDLEPRLGADVMSDMQLLVSELVTNSVKYGEEGCVRLEVTEDGGRLRTEIVNEGSGFEHVERDGDLEREGGWGLHLVEHVADDWGAFEGSTHVWFEIDLARARDASA